MTLIGWWPLHDGSATDYSGNGNHGTLNGGVTTGVAGRGGLEAMSFDGTDDYVGLGSRNAPTSITLSAWALWDGSTDSNQYIFSGGYDGTTAEFELFLSTNGEFYWNTYDGSSRHGITASYSPPINEWFHVTAVYDNSAGEYRLYVNGELKNSVSDSYSPSDANNSNQWMIGASSQPTNAKYWTGAICDVRVYSRALTSSEIQTLYEWGSTDLAQPPQDGIAYYKLDGDATDNWGSNDGTNNGVSFVSDSIRGQAGSFEAANSDDIVITSESSFDVGGTSDATWSWWEKPTSNNQIIQFSKAVSGSDRNYQFYLDSNRNYKWYDTANGGIVFSNVSSPPANEWRFCTLIHDGSKSEVRLYINGILEDTISLGSDIQTNNGDFYVGNDTYGNYRDGLLDDFRFYDFALKPYEIFELYQYGTFGRDMRKQLVNART